MANGYQSIDDLLKKDAAPVGGAPASGTQVVQGINTAAITNPTEKVEAKFQEKMQKIALQEKEIEAQRLAIATGIPYIDLMHFPVSQLALKQIKKDEAEALDLVCFYASQAEMRFASTNPRRPEVEAKVQEITKAADARGAVYTVSKQSFDRIIDLYKTLPEIKQITKEVTVNVEAVQKIKESITDFASFGELLKGASLTDLLAYIFGGALKLDTSDVHIEAEKENVMVRFRLDGILKDVAELPSEGFKKLVSRLKLLAGLKINISDKPQDGRFTIKLPDGDVDVRVSTIPTIYGESIVMRLLVQNKQRMTFEGLGLSERAYKQLKTQIERPNGMIITTGPTGSGKTTTLYTIMQKLNNPDVKIITMEDPVEYKMEGINQSQIDKSRGYTFAKGLRSILRQDPDIAMVGEIRDLETAEIAIQASLTGHLILSTIHTNDSFGAIPRFLSMGVKPFLLSPALNAVIGQRLLRRLCEVCKQPVALDTDKAQRVQAELDALPEDEKAKLSGRPLNFYGAKGCEKCNNSGYKGRVGIYEIFVVDETIEKAILEGKVAESDIKAIAVEKGTVTMVQDGILKALEGLTSIDEVYRVTE